MNSSSHRNGDARVCGAPIVSGSPFCFVRITTNNTPSHHGALPMSHHSSLAVEMATRARVIHRRLMYPPNPVPDRGIDLHPKRIPPEDVPEDHTHINVEILEIPGTYNQRLRVGAIARAVSQHFHTPIAEIRGPSRKKVICLPRHVIMYLLLNTHVIPCPTSQPVRSL